MPFVAEVSQEKIFDLQAKCKIAWMSIIPDGVKQMLFTPENMAAYDIWFEPIIEIVFNPLSKNTNVNIYYKKSVLANIQGRLTKSLIGTVIQQSVLDEEFTPKEALRWLTETDSPTTNLVGVLQQLPSKLRERIIAKTQDDENKPQMYECAENIHNELASKIQVIASEHFAYTIRK